LVKRAIPTSRVAGCFDSREIRNDLIPEGLEPLAGGRGNGRAAGDGVVENHGAP